MNDLQLAARPGLPAAPLFPGREESGNRWSRAFDTAFRQESEALSKMTGEQLVVNFVEDHSETLARVLDLARMGQVEKVQGVYLRIIQQEAERRAQIYADTHYGDTGHDAHA